VCWVCACVQESRQMHSRFLIAGVCVLTRCCGCLSCYCWGRSAMHFLNLLGATSRHYHWLLQEQQLRAMQSMMHLPRTPQHLLYFSKSTRWAVCLCDRRSGDKILLHVELRGKSNATGLLHLWSVVYCDGDSVLFPQQLASVTFAWSCFWQVRAL
jgi:hypothetical protein